MGSSQKGTHFRLNVEFLSEKWKSEPLFQVHFPTIENKSLNSHILIGPCQTHFTQPSLAGQVSSPLAPFPLRHSVFVRLRLQMETSTALSTRLKRCVMDWWRFSL